MHGCASRQTGPKPNYTVISFSYCFILYLWTKGRRWVISFNLITMKPLLEKNIPPCDVTALKKRKTALLRDFTINFLLIARKQIRILTRSPPFSLSLSLRAIAHWSEREEEGKKRLYCFIWTNALKIHCSISLRRVTMKPLRFQGTAASPLESNRSSSVLLVLSLCSLSHFLSHPPFKCVAEETNAPLIPTLA